MEQAGMPRFDDVLDVAQVEQIHAYIIARAHEDYALRQEQGWLGAVKDYATDISARVAAWLVRFQAGGD